MVRGIGSNNSASTLDNDWVTVLDRCSKVIVVLPMGTDDGKRVNTSKRVMNTPIDNSVNINWG